ncbi:ankyrin repeat domain-containing protein [Mucilaginibacter sp. UR6-1]|uniref:ankyrin repeat domain-containing protein n=1 Tax=Mucilaginibacter sp. UR6-1 TaxID=1435643 RepID=UPI001E556AC2|nr:ankyrin repeat domain-containing protein [Mucilaginibacter sp. UR6-1]MCC8409183.1 ankyrin repeat domain-containing protein [Mucilaginibacter sp. UR6-1]
MTNEFNTIRDAYHKNMFASSAEAIDIISLYKSLPDVDIVNEQEEGLYNLAARFTDVEAIKFLKEAGLKPSADKYGNTALHALVTTKFDLNNPEIDVKADKIYQTAQQLLELGINPKKKNDSGKLAYFEAGLLYLYPLINAMGDAGVKMDATDSEGKNLLHVICEKLVHRKSIPGAVEAATHTVRALLEKSGIDLEDKDVYGTTPLIYAQCSGVKEIAALLSGDESDTVTAGMTLHEAVLNRDVEAVEALLKAGADANELSDQHRRTPLMLACEYPSAPLVKALTDGGADVNFRSGNGDTAVYYLLTKAIGNFGRGMSQDLKDIVKMLRMLIAHGFELDEAINNDGDTAINLVCQGGYLADLNATLVEELIDAGCDINKPNTLGKTPLMSFAAKGNEVKYSIAELLLDNNADTTYVDKTGNTALMYAAGNADKMSAKKIVSLIVDQDASTVERVNNAGQTAMDIAVQSDNEPVVKLLLTAMA